MNEEIKRGQKSSTTRLGALLNGVLGRLGLAQSMGGWNAVVHWPEIVGELVASRSKAIRYEDDTLLVSVPDAAWRQELLMDTDRILGKIHDLPGGKAVKKIRFVS